MHPNAALLEKLYTDLAQHDHEAMAACYHEDATFNDIAFDLSGKKEIHAMWHMISESDLKITFDIIRADEHTGRVNWVADYTLTATGRNVHNVIESRFHFHEGLIIEQRDLSDAKAWAAMAVGGPAGFVGGRVRFLRSQRAITILRDFVKEHPEYK